jgi:hypothetical protein
MRETMTNRLLGRVEAAADLERDCPFVGLALGLIFVTSVLTA